MVRSAVIVAKLHATVFRTRSNIVSACGEKKWQPKILLVDDSKTALMIERAILEKRTTYPPRPEAQRNERHFQLNGARKG